MRGATLPKFNNGREIGISIHAPHAGRDYIAVLVKQLYLDFNPRAPCGARLQDFIQGGVVVVISIHAPHAGRDRLLRKLFNGRK